MKWGFTGIVAAAALFAACSDDGHDGTGGGGDNTTSAPSCAASTGTLTGTAMIPGSAIGGMDQPADDATIILQPASGTAIQARADAEGRFEVLLEAGDWTVSAEHPSQCFTMSPSSVTITACGTAEVTLVLDECFG